MASASVRECHLGPRRRCLVSYGLGSMDVIPLRGEFRLGIEMPCGGYLEGDIR